ncbi:M20 family metallopeptidase [Cetobacterium somerae]|uniref:M20 family metallopeptidase n=1 Tax=Cetobacterium sp. NK01 TaxID=2993530 RepID=UPI0021161021|nr:M20 family metallopeptidase [Cetobacterium sp. NK01]MCQ8211329.1 M20 family metallopeptidase [Cetobacterium sp. NK01]
MKQEVLQNVDELKDSLINLGDFIFDNPEIGLEEFKSSKKLIEILEKNGFKVEVGIGGFKTAFKAIYEVGENGPSIGLLCEYDALEGMGHACAHHLQGPSIVGAALSLKNKLKNRNYKIVVYGTPAEETIGAKVKMLENGCFNDIDIALMMHGAPDTTTDVKSLALSNFTVKFHGVRAHAALAPEKGRSALDGLILLFQGIEFLREHVREDVKMHYTITNAGGPANVVPKYAEAKFSIRSYDRAYLDHVIERFKKVVQGASLMTETDYEIIETKRLNNKIPVLKLNQILMNNAELIKAPRLSPPREKTGSTDFGNVMYHVPGSCIRIAFVPQGTSSHSDEFLCAGKSIEAHQAIVLGAKILAGTAYDLINNSELFKEVLSEFKTNKEKSEKI